MRPATTVKLALAATITIGSLGFAGVGQATPEASPSSVTADSPVVESVVVPSARAAKAKVRERRSARDAIRQAVADRALRQEGDSYAAGGEGPNAFDCSGLTLFAWRGAGVELTHYSAGQYQQVRKIDESKAMPGDLVFYLTGGARHVAVYIGDGQIVHASDYGVGVIVSPVRGTPWTNAHFTGFGRVEIPDAAVEEMIEKRRARA
jgi:cell wall-associated NlpC family hydrolase